MPANMVDPDSLVDAAVLSEWLGVNKQAISDAAKDGIITRPERGRYPLRDSVRAYCRHAMETAAGRGQVSNAKALTAQRVLHEKQKVAKATMENDVRRGELVPVSKVESEWARVFTMVRSRLLTVPARFGQLVPRLETLEVTSLDRLIRDALTELGSDPYGDL